VTKCYVVHSFLTWADFMFSQWYRWWAGSSAI